MQCKSKLIKAVINTVGIATVCFAMPVFAEAPVYDADAMQQGDASAADPTQDLPMPPPPGQESAFVPMQSAASMPSPPSPTNPALSNDQRMKRVEQQLANLQANNSSTRVDSLQKEVQTLRGQVEQLTHKLQELDAQQKSQYTDLDKRLSQQTVPVAEKQNKAADKLADKSADKSIDAADDTVAAAASKATQKLASAKVKATDSKSATPAAKSVSDQPNVAEEQEIYQTAYNLIKAKKYEEAVKVLQGMLQKYPSGQFASNAHYWLGELYGLLGKHDQALSEFSTVVKTYPDSPRLPDAQLKVGLIYAAQMNWTDAKGAFKKVINNYPGTASSRLASEQLKQIKQAGH